MSKDKQTKIPHNTPVAIIPKKIKNEIECRMPKKRDKLPSKKNVDQTNETIIQKSIDTLFFDFSYF